MPHFNPRQLPTGAGRAVATSTYTDSKGQVQTRMAFVGLPLVFSVSSIVTTDSDGKTVTQTTAFEHTPDTRAGTAQSTSRSSTLSSSFRTLSAPTFAPLISAATSSSQTNSPSTDPSQTSTTLSSSTTSPSPTVAASSTPRASSSKSPLIVGLVLGIAIFRGILILIFIAIRFFRQHRRSRLAGSLAAQPTFLGEFTGEEAESPHMLHGRSLPHMLDGREILELHGKSKSTELDTKTAQSSRI